MVFVIQKIGRIEPRLPTVAGLAWQAMTEPLELEDVKSEALVERIWDTRDALDSE